MNLKRVFTPITLNQMTVKNRLAMTAMHLLYTEDGSVNQRTKEFYLARARGGVGMIIAGGAAADPYIGYSHMLRMDQDRFVPGWKDLADAVHAYDCKLCVQFLTPGRYGRAEFVEGDTDLLSASDVYAKMTGTTPRPMTAEEIRRIQENYARAALRCKQAGIDGVEITAGSGYLICQFLSPVTNKREDAYGGSFDNRCRFGVELVQAVRDAVGPITPIDAITSPSIFSYLFLFCAYFILLALHQPYNIGPVPPEGHGGDHCGDTIKFRSGRSRQSVGSHLSHHHIPDH